MSDCCSCVRELKMCWEFIFLKKFWWMAKRLSRTFDLFRMFKIKRSWLCHKQQRHIQTQGDNLSMVFLTHSYRVRSNFCLSPSTLLFISVIRTFFENSYTAKKKWKNNHTLLLSWLTYIYALLSCSRACMCVCSCMFSYNFFANNKNV